jgi:hypothetical protein
VHRRSFLAMLASVSCGAPNANTRVAAPVDEAFATTPLAALWPMKGLNVLVYAAPKMIYAALAAELSPLVSEARLRALRAQFGVDLKSASEATYGDYESGALWGVSGAIDAGAVEQAFTKRCSTTQARKVVNNGDGSSRAAQSVTVQGISESAPAAMLSLGMQAALFEQGQTGGALTIASLFASKRLHKAKPAIALEPLAPMLALLGDAPVHVLAPGPFSPFSGEWGNGVSGLLKTATAVGARVRIEGTLLRIAICITGLPVTSAGAEVVIRASSTFDRITASAFGQLAGLDHYAEAPQTRVEGEALWIHVAYNARALAEGIARALDGEISDILR